MWYEASHHWYYIQKAGLELIGRHRMILGTVFGGYNNMQEKAASITICKASLACLFQMNECQLDALHHG